MGLLAAGTRSPAFGDYAIASPELPQGDMRLLKPSATVRYTVNDGWIIAKGLNVRDNGFEQISGVAAERDGGGNLISAGLLTR